MSQVLYGPNDAYIVHDAIPSRRRRSQPSLDTRPYPPRPAPANSSNSSSNHCMSDDSPSPGYVSVKMEPRQGAGSDGSGGGGNGGGGGGGMFPDYSGYLPAIESPHSPPGSGGGQQSAYFSSSSSSSSSSSASSAASSAAATPMAYEHHHHHHQAACLMRPTTAPAASYGAAVVAAVPAAVVAPAAAAAAATAFRRDGYAMADEDNFISTHQIPTQSGIATVAPDNTQLPSPEDFSVILDQYINDLSPKKQDKALIPSKRLTNIEAVLRDPKCTTIESAQFRFWAKKMFRLGLNERNGRECVMHEDKPVAVREKLYRVLTTAHFEAQHGGRDKTSAQVRAGYSW